MGTAKEDIVKPAKIRSTEVINITAKVTSVFIFDDRVVTSIKHVNSMQYYDGQRVKESRDMSHS